MVNLGAVCIARSEVDEDVCQMIESFDMTSESDVKIAGLLRG